MQKINKVSEQTDIFDVCLPECFHIVYEMAVSPKTNKNNKYKIGNARN